MGAPPPEATVLAVDPPPPRTVVDAQPAAPPHTAAVTHATRREGLKAHGAFKMHCAQHGAGESSRVGRLARELAREDAAELACVVGGAQHGAGESSRVGQKLAREDAAELACVVGGGSRPRRGCRGDDSEGPTEWLPPR